MNKDNKDNAVKELFLLQRVAQKINSILDLDILLEEVVDDVAKTFGYSRAGVLLKDEKTNELVIAAVRGWTVNFHIKGDRFKIGEYGIIGHVGATEETYYAPDVTTDPYYEVSEESTRSEVDIPLKVRGNFIGVFGVQHQEKNAFTPERIRLLEALAEHVATAIENARLFQNERREKERMSRELDEARKVQLSLFPGADPQLPGFKITGSCIPCREVGGDWFDYIPLGEGRLAVVIGDVSGKGSGAALLMASTRSILRMFAEKESSPGEVLDKVNRLLIKDFPRSKFITMIYAVIDPVNKNIVFANAGHLPPLLIDSQDSRFLEIDSGLPLGIQNIEFNEYRIDIQADSRFILYSDGISEAMNADFEEYGTERLRNHMSKPSATVDSLIKDVSAFAGDFPAMDDKTAVIIGTYN